MTLEQCLGAIIPCVARCLASGSYFTDIADLLTALDVPSDAADNSSSSSSSSSVMKVVKKYEAASRRFSFFENVCCPFLLLSNCEEHYSIFFNFTGNSDSESSSSISRKKEGRVREYVQKLYTQVLRDFDIFIDILTDKIDTSKGGSPDFKSSSSEKRRSNRRNSASNSSSSSTNSSNNNSSLLSSNSDGNNRLIPVVIEMLRGLSVFIALRLTAIDILRELKNAVDSGNNTIVDSRSNLSELAETLSNAIKSSRTHFSVANFSTTSSVLAVDELLSGITLESKIIISFIDCLNGAFSLNYIKFVAKLSDYKSYLNQFNDRIIEQNRNSDNESDSNSNVLLSSMHYFKWFLWLKWSHHIYFNTNKSYTELKLLCSEDIPDQGAGHNHLIKNVIKILYHGRDTLQGNASNSFYMSESSTTYFMIISKTNTVLIDNIIINTSNVSTTSSSSDKWLPIFARQVFVTNSSNISSLGSAHHSFEVRDRLEGGGDWSGGGGHALAEAWPLVASFFDQINSSSSSGTGTAGIASTNNTHYQRLHSLLLLATPLALGSAAATYIALVCVGCAEASDVVVEEMAERMQSIRKCLCNPVESY